MMRKTIMIEKGKWELRATFPEVTEDGDVGEFEFTIYDDQVCSGWFSATKEELHWFIESLYAELHGGEGAET